MYNNYLVWWSLLTNNEHIIQIIFKLHFWAHNLFSLPNYKIIDYMSLKIMNLVLFLCSLCFVKFFKAHVIVCFLLPFFFSQFERVISLSYSLTKINKLSLLVLLCLYYLINTIRWTEIYLKSFCDYVLIF